MYIFLQNQSRKNKFYWRCNQRISIGCKGTAQTIFVDRPLYIYMVKIVTTIMLPKPVNQKLQK